MKDNYLIALVLFLIAIVKGFSNLLNIDLVWLLLILGWTVLIIGDVVELIIERGKDA